VSKLITELSIRNFAIIDDISITFHDGLTVMTGETGAGKSIIIDALELLTGGRGSVDFVRHGAKKAEISGLFFIKATDALLMEQLKDHGIDIEENMLVLERTITHQGKSICRINGKIVTLTLLRAFGSKLVNIHSQHDTIQLMDPKSHLPLLDVYNITELNPIKNQYDHHYKAYMDLLREYKALSESEQATAQRIDLLQFQLRELEEAQLQENEDEQLSVERNQLANFERIYRAILEAYHALYGDVKGLEWVDIAQKELQEAKNHDPMIEANAEKLTNLYYQLEEISSYLRDYGDELHFDETRLNEIEARLHTIGHLQKKYGATVNDMLIYKKEVKAELNKLKHKDIHLESLQSKLAERKSLVLEVAKQLHDVRKQTALDLEENIHVELKDLFLENARFLVHFANGEREPDENGIDHITFLLSTNLGEPVKELAKTASGGELSRIMLALKRIFAKHDQIGTVIFDEIDTGVSGRVAQAISEKVFQISRFTQVLSITHLPQVAAMADHHLLIQKEVIQNHTKTKLTDLDQRQQIKELGKMMTGSTLTDTAMEHSKELLTLTSNFKAANKKTS
jgi:DNA repair protein RecN (Recombination protein N)